MRARKRTESFVAELFSATDLFVVGIGRQIILRHFNLINGVFRNVLFRTLSRIVRRIEC